MKAGNIFHLRKMNGCWPGAHFSGGNNRVSHARPQGRYNTFARHDLHLATATFCGKTVSRRETQVANVGLMLYAQHHFCIQKHPTSPQREQGERRSMQESILFCIQKHLEKLVMNQKLFKGLLAAVALGCLSTAVAAQDEKKSDAGPLFSRLDANNDGQITANEISEDRKGFFDRLLRVSDKNGDGKLSREEFAQGTRAGDPPNRPESDQPRRSEGQPDPEQFFKRMDANGDGKVVLDEIPEERRARFREQLGRSDKNGDGALTLDEFRAGFAQSQRPQATPAAGQPPAGRQPPAAGDRPAGTPPEGRPDPANAPFFRALDTNTDGKISAEELAKAAESLKRLDRNGDGFLTPEELVPPGPRGVGGRPQPAGAAAGTPPGRPGQAGFADALRERIKQADTNGDGKLSKEEAPDRLKENFDRLDANKDGFLDMEEAREMFERLRQRAGEAGNRRPAGNPEPKKESNP